MMSLGTCKSHKESQVDQDSQTLLPCLNDDDCGDGGDEDSEKEGVGFVLEGVAICRMRW